MTHRAPSQTVGSGHRDIMSRLDGMSIPHRGIEALLRDPISPFRAVSSAGQAVVPVSVRRSTGAKFTRSFSKARGAVNCKNALHRTSGGGDPTWPTLGLWGVVLSCPGPMWRIDSPHNWSNKAHNGSNSWRASVARPRNIHYRCSRGGSGARSRGLHSGRTFRHIQLAH